MAHAERETELTAFNVTLYALVGISPIWDGFAACMGSTAAE